MGRFLGYALVAMVLGSGVVASGCGSPADAAAVSEARAAVGRGALLLDVRTVDEFGAGHIAGATNIPVQVLAERVGEITPGQDIVVYCKSGRRSAAAAAMLRERGHKVIDIGPMGAW